MDKILKQHILESVKYTRCMFLDHLRALLLIQVLQVVLPAPVLMYYMSVASCT